MSISLSSIIEKTTHNKTPINHTVFLPMENVIQNYPWGSTSSLSDLFNFENACGEPQAELWMGAHPNGCSVISFKGVQQDLASFIDSNPTAILGERFGDNAMTQPIGLPFLFKVLCAEKALSIQVHPNRQQAQLGFEEDQRKGIALTAFNRNYKDPNHKPELVYALTPYTAMNGFRHIPEIIGLFENLDSKTLAPIVERFAKSPNSQGLEAFFYRLLSLDGEEKSSAIQDLIGFVRSNESPLNAQVNTLAQQYPNDVGLFAPLLLNLVTLNPGEAMYLDAETPHAYIKGTALEIMANSDNVLRAGLTNKYLDVDELVSCTQFVETPTDALLLKPSLLDGELNYPVPVEDFKFSILMNPIEHQVIVDSAEILFAIDAPIYLEHQSGEVCCVAIGHSVFIPAYSKNYKVTSSGQIARSYY